MSKPSTPPEDVRSWLQSCRQWRSDRSAFACLLSHKGKNSTVHLDPMKAQDKWQYVTPGVESIGPRGFDVEVALMREKKSSVWNDGIYQKPSDGQQPSAGNPITLPSLEAPPFPTSLTIAVTSMEELGTMQTVNTKVQFKRGEHVYAQATLAHPRSPAVGILGASAIVVPYPLANMPKDESLFYKRIKWLEGFAARAAKFNEKESADNDLTSKTVALMGKSRYKLEEVTLTRLVGLITGGGGQDINQTRPETEKEVKQEIKDQFNEVFDQKARIRESIVLSFETPGDTEAESPFGEVTLMASDAGILQSLYRLFQRSPAIRSTTEVLETVVKLLIEAIVGESSDPEEERQNFRQDIKNLAQALGSEPLPSKPLQQVNEPGTRFYVATEASSGMVLPMLPRGFAAETVNTGGTDGSTMQLRWGDHYGPRAASRLSEFRCVRLLRTDVAASYRNLEITENSEVRNVLVGMTCGMAYPPRAVRRAASLKAPIPPSSKPPSTSQPTWTPPKHFMHSLGIDPTDPHHLAAFLGFCDLLVLEQLRGSSNDSRTDNRFARLFDTAIASAQGMAMAASDLIDAMIDRQKKNTEVVFSSDPVFLSNAGRAARIVLQHHTRHRSADQFPLDDATRSLFASLRRLSAQRKLLIHPSRWPVIAVQSLAVHRDTTVHSPDSLLDLQLHMASTRFDGLRLERPLYAPIEDLQIGAAVDAFKRMRVFRTNVNEYGLKYLMRALQMRPGAWVPLEERNEAWWQGLESSILDHGNSSLSRPSSSATSALWTDVTTAKRIIRKAVLPFWSGRQIPWQHGQTASDMVTFKGSMQEVGYRFRVGFGDYSYSYPTHDYVPAFADTPIDISLVSPALSELKSDGAQGAPLTPTFVLSATDEASRLDMNELTVRRKESQYELDAWLCCRSEPNVADQPVDRQEDDSTQHMLWDVDRVAQLMSIAASVVMDDDNIDDVPARFTLQITCSPNISRLNATRLWVTCALASIVSQKYTYGSAVRPVLQLSGVEVIGTSVDLLLETWNSAVQLMKTQQGSFDMPLVEVVNALLVKEGRV